MDGGVVNLDAQAKVVSFERSDLGKSMAGSGQYSSIQDRHEPYSRSARAGFEGPGFDFWVLGFRGGFLE